MDAGAVDRRRRDADLGGHDHRCHHPLRMGDRLYTSFWQGGFVILDIADCRSPSTYRGSTGARRSHARPIVRCRCRSRSTAANFWWSPTRMSSTSFRGRRPSSGSLISPTKSGRCRSRPSRSMRSTERRSRRRPAATSRSKKSPAPKFPPPGSPTACASSTLRVPRAPREVAYFVPDPAPGEKRPSSNDVFVDDRGLIYLVDRVRGFHILERI